MRHNQPLLDPPWWVLLHGIPVRHQHERLVEHLLGCIPALPVLDLTHDRDDDAHPPTVLLCPLGVGNVVRRIVLEGWIHHVGVERFGLVVDAWALRLEEVVVVGRRLDLCAVYGNIGGDGVPVARGYVEG